MVKDDFLLVIFTTPLIPRALQMDLYKVNNLPASHAEIRVHFVYILEGQYLLISKQMLYAAIPTEHDIRICMTTEEYLCMLY